MLLDDLKKEKMNAMKEKNNIKKDILSIAISKVQLVLTDKRGRGEELTDGDVLQVINKTVKEVDEEALSFKNANRLEKYQELLEQKSYLVVFLPKLLTEEEIKDIINKLGDKSIPVVMKHFKENYQGKVDMGLVSKIAKSL